MRSLDVIPTELLDQLIALWLVNLKRPDGRDYEPNSNVSALKCYIAELGHDTKQLEMTAKVVSAKRTELKSRGHGNTPNRVSCLSEKQETHLWETGALGDGNSDALVHAVWYCTTKGFGFRGCNKARQLVGSHYQKNNWWWRDLLWMEWEAEENTCWKLLPPAPICTQNLPSAPVGVPFACMNFMNPKAHLMRSANHFFSASITIVHMTAVPGLSTCPRAWTDWGKLCPVQRKVLGWLMGNSAIIVCVLQCVHSCARKGSPILWSLSCLGTNVPKIWLRMPWRARNNNTKWMTSCKILLPKRLHNSSGSFGAIGNAPHSRAVATATTAKSPASSPKHVEAAPATAGTLPISSNTVVSNILDQSTGLRGLLSNATLNGPVTFNFNIHHHHHAATDSTISTQSHM